MSWEIAVCRRVARLPATNPGKISIKAMEMPRRMEMRLARSANSTQAAALYHTCSTGTPQGDRGAGGKIKRAPDPLLSIRSHQRCQARFGNNFSPADPIAYG